MLVNPIIYSRGGGSGAPKINNFKGANLIYDVLLNENINFIYRDERSLTVPYPFSENPNLTYEIHCKVAMGAVSSTTYSVIFEAGNDNNNLRHIAVTANSAALGNNADFGLCAWGATNVTSYLPVDNLKFDEWYTFTFILDTSVNSITVYINGNFAGTISSYEGTAFTGTNLIYKINTSAQSTYKRDVYCTRARIFQSQLNVAQILNNYTLDLQSL